MSEDRRQHGIIAMAQFALKLTHEMGELYKLQDGRPAQLLQRVRGGMSKRKTGLLKSFFKTVEVALAQPARATKVEKVIECSEDVIEKAERIIEEGQQILEANLKRFQDTLKDFIVPGAGGDHELFIQSSEPAILNLPWEIAKLPDNNLAIGFDLCWALRRSPVGELTEFKPQPKPLRILYFASSPEDPTTEPIHYEREEAQLLAAVRRAQRGKVAIELRFGELGTLQELKDLVGQFRPHVVHLSGHANFDSFAFEDQRGRVHWVTAEHISQYVFRDSQVSCVVLNACETADSQGLWQILCKNGTPYIVGWPIQVPDEAAISFASALYAELAVGMSVPKAVTRARLALKIERFPLLAALPQVHCSKVTRKIFDPSRTTKRRWPSSRDPISPDIQSLETNMFGRRRDVRYLVEELLTTDTGCAILHGPQYVGKSTLASRVAGVLRTRGYKIIPIKPTDQVDRDEHPDATFAKILTMLRSSFPKDDKLKRTTSPEQLVSQLARRRVLLVLDDFEKVLVKDRFEKSPIHGFYRALLTRFHSDAKAIITTQVVPKIEVNDARKRRFITHPVTDLDLRSFTKFLDRDDDLRERLPNNHGSNQLIDTLHEKLGGNPGLWALLTRRLKCIDPSMTSEETDWLNLIEQMARKERKDFLDGALFTELLESLPLENQIFISCLAHSPYPLPYAVAERMAGLQGERCPDVVKKWIAEGDRHSLIEEVRSYEESFFQVPRIFQDRLTRDLERHKRHAPWIDSIRVHGFLADFWQEVFKNAQPVGNIEPETKLAYCRFHACHAGAHEQWKWATGELAEWLREKFPERSQKLRAQLAAPMPLALSH